MIYDKEINDGDRIQKPNIYNKYLPFYDTLQHQIPEAFDEIKMRLSQTIQLIEIEPGFSLWSTKLSDFILLYGYSFTKTDHIKLINFYLSVLSIENLNYVHVKTCFDLLEVLLRKVELITRNELTIDWRILYHWGRIIRFHHDQDYSLEIMPNNIELSFCDCVGLSCYYFSETATQEMLDEFRPWLCPFDTSCDDAMYFFHHFLPVNLPPELHHQGFKLWLPELLGIWESISSSTNWQSYFIPTFSCIAWNNIGYIDWEPWIPQIFTRFLRDLSLPVGTLSTTSQNITYLSSAMASLMVAMIGNGGSCLQYVKDLFTAIKSFYHPSNTGDFQQYLVNFLSELATKFVERVCLEINAEKPWYFQTLQSYKLTDQDITDFVNCLKECVYISIFNKTYLGDAAIAFRSLAMLRPELIILPIIEQLFVSVDNMIEPHRFTSILYCLSQVTFEIVSPKSTFPQNQTYVLPLLIAVLPGIDSSDLDKTNVTLQFLISMLTIITCVDCSSAIDIQEDLTEIEKEVCFSTAKFEDFIIEFLNRTFQIIEHNYEDSSTVIDLTSVVSVIVQQCSEKLFEVVRKKITNFLAVPSIGSNVDNSVTYILVRPILQTNPIETLKYLLPQTCERIEKILDDWEATIFTDYQGDPELTWYVVLFSELLQARGDTLLIYKPIILSVFHRCVQLIDKESYNAMANAAQYLLRSLSNAYPVEYRLTLENIDEPFTDFLPIRAWGKHVELDNLKPQFHIPNAEEISFACDIVETFLYRELTFLNEKDSCISKDERLRSLTLLSSIIIGCLRMVPSVDSEEVSDLVPTLVSLESQYKTPCSIYPSVPKFKENLRRRIINDLGNLLDHLINKHPDDAASISFALQIYALSPCYYGVLADEYDGAFADFDTAIYSFESEINSKRCYPRFIMIRRLVEQMDLLSLHHNEPFTEIDKQVVIKLAELSMNRYCGIRMNAQQSLFVLLTRFQFSYEVIIDRLLELLNASNEINHDEFKGCLYILLGTDFVFLPGKHSWKLLEKLWPSIAKTTHVTKTSTQDLILQIVYKINQQFDTPSIIEETNISAIRAAAALWRPLDAQEMKISIENREKRTQENIQSYNNLIGEISFSTSNTHLTWQQQQRMVYLLGQLFQKKVPLSTSFIRTGLDLFVHDNIELRSLACNYIAAVCRLQKLPRIYVEKTRDEVMHRTINDECHPGDRDDNLWVTLNDYKPPKTQIEWEESCFLDKSFHGYYQWPKIIRYPLNKRDRYTQENMPEQVAIIYDRFVDKTFLTHAIQLMVLDLDGGNGFNVHRYRMFKGLFRNFGEAFVDNFMEILYTLIHEQTTEKQEASSQLAAEIVAGIIRGSKYWTIEMHNELWLKLTPFLNEVCANLSWEVVTSWYYCFWHVLGDADPRRMYRVIEFLLSLMNIPSTANGISETSRWYLVKILSNCEWHIPKVWHAVSVYAKELLDHPHSAVRERIISIFNRAFYCDVTLPNGQSTRHPNMNLFLSFIRKRLQEATDICEKSSRVDSSDEFAKIISERQQALVFIETVIELYIKILSGCLQPIKRGMIELFPELCNLENIVSHDEDLQVRLTLSRTTITTLHIQVPFLEEFIEQIECVIKSDKWHARRAAIEFIQYLIFGNLFNARPFSPRIRKIVLEHLSDEQLEVRTIASVTLAGLYQCNFIPLTKEDLECFCWMSKTKYSIKVDDKKITLTENIIKRHGGVLGLCAMVLSAPYDTPLYIPDALMQICEHLQDPILIRESVKYALAEFRRTHHDSWHEHREKFTNEQLVVLTDVLISPSYYA